jgi:hypothetical protein
MKVKALKIKLEMLAAGVAIADATDQDWLQAAGVTDITPPTQSASVSEESYLDGSGWIEKDTGDINPGELSAVLAWDPEDAQQQAMYADFKSGTKRWYRLNYTLAVPPVTDKYYGVLSEWGKAIAKGEKVSRSVKFALSGEQQEA